MRRQAASHGVLRGAFVALTASLALVSAVDECMQPTAPGAASTGLYLLQAHAALRPRGDVAFEAAQAEAPGRLKPTQAEGEANEVAELVFNLQNSSTVDAYFAHRAAIEATQDRRQQLLSRTAPSVSPWAQHQKPSWTDEYINNFSNCYTGVVPPAGSEGFGDGLGDLRGPLVSDLKPVEGATLRVINAGMGTTATRGLHEAMCEQGVPSVHWGRACHVHPEARTKVNKVLTIYKEFMKCANLEYDRQDPRCSIETVKGTLLPALRDVVTSGVVSVSDAPYADLLPTMLALVPGLKVGQTLRDRDVWADRRLRFHGLDVVCKSRKARGAASYFDSLGCAGKGVRWVSDALLSQRKAFGWDSQKFGKDKAYAILATRFAAHNAVFAQPAGVIPGLGGLRQFCAWDTGFADSVRETARAIAAAGGLATSRRGRSLLQEKQDRKEGREVELDEQEEKREVRAEAEVEELQKAAAAEELLGQDDLQGDPTMSLFQRFEATFARRTDAEGAYPRAGEFFQWLQQEHEAAPYRTPFS